MRNFRFASILIALSTVLLVAVVSASIGYLRQSLEQSTYKDLETFDKRASQALSAQVENRFELYRAQAAVTSAEPRIRAVVGTDGINAATVVGVARDIQEGLGADIFLLTDGEGYLLGDTADPEAQGFDMSGMPLIAGALDKGAASGTWSVNGKPHQVVSKAIMLGQGITGVLVIGYGFEQPFFDALHTQTGVSIGLRSDDTMLASSPAPADVNAASVDGFWSALLADPSNTVTLPSATYTRTAIPLAGYSGDASIEFILTQSVDLAMAAARNLQERLTLIAGIFVAFGALVFVVFSRVLGKSLGRLVSFTQALGRGELGGTVTVSGPRELAVLGEAMNRMSTDLESAQREIMAAKAEVESLNASLESKVRDRTRELRVVNREVQEILDNLTDAVFIIDDQLNLVGRTSPACKDVLGLDNLIGRSVKDFLFVGDERQDESLALALSSLTFAFGMDADMFELNVPHLPTTWAYEHPAYEPGSDERQRVLNLSYCPLEDADGEVTRILVVASDLTTLLKLERENKAKDEVLRKRTTAMSDILGGKRSELPEFMASFARLFASARDQLRLAATGDQEARAVILRDLHTIKGNARATRLGVLSSEVHGIESAVIKSLTSDDLALEEAFAPMVDLAETYVGLFDEFFSGGGDKAQNTGAVSNRVLRRLSALQHASSVGDAIRDLQRAWQAETLGEVYPLAERFVERHTPMLEEVAGRLAKRVEFLPLVGDDLLALGVVSNVLDQYAGHLVRNAIDHGLETPEERLAAGKTSVGHVWIEVSTPRADTHDDRVEFVFCDDGRGIDTGRVLHLARAKGVVPADWTPSSDAEVFDLLFRSGFSTKDTVSEISGRGVGLDAVRSAVREFGGDVYLRNRANGQGSEAVFKIPRSLVRFHEVGGQLLGVNEDAPATTSPQPALGIAREAQGTPLMSTSKKKILIVDDQPVFRGTLAASVRAHALGDHLDPIEAENGLEALRLVKAHDDIVCAVVDVHMPVMRGTDFIRSFRHERREQFDQTLTFMMTTEGDPELRQEFKELGLAGWIVKPVDPEFFVRALSKKFIPNNPQPFAKAVGE